MINSKEFEVLCILQENTKIDENKYRQEIKSLLSDKMIYFNVTGSDRNNVYYHGFVITPKGQRAYEEYKAFQFSQKATSETLKAAKEANELSSEANKISRGAKRISFWAIIVSAVATIISVVGIIVSALT